MFERSETREQGKLRKRLRAAAGPKAAKRIDFVKEAEKLSAVKPLDAALGADAAESPGSLQQLLDPGGHEADGRRTAARVGVPVLGGRGS